MLWTIPERFTGVCPSMSMVRVVCWDCKATDAFPIPCFFVFLCLVSHFFFQNQASHRPSGNHQVVLFREEFNEASFPKMGTLSFISPENMGTLRLCFTALNQESSGGVTFLLDDLMRCWAAGGLHVGNRWSEFLLGWRDHYCWWFRNPAITSWYGKYM